MTDHPNDGSETETTTTTTTTTTETETEHTTAARVAGRAARWTRDATVPVWSVIVGALLIVGMFSVMVWRIEDTRRDTRSAISCAFELVLAPFPEAADVLDTIHEALETGGFPIVTLESCRRAVAAAD